MQLSRSLTLLELLLFYIFANANVQELKCIASLEQANTLFFCIAQYLSIMFSKTMHSLVPNNFVTFS